MTAPCVIFWCGQIHYVGKWEGVGLWKWRVVWAQWNGIEPIGECHLEPEKLEISRAQCGEVTSNPSPLHPFYSPPPHPELIRNQQQTVRCIKGHNRSVRRTPPRYCCTQLRVSSGRESNFCGRQARCDNNLSTPHPPEYTLSLKFVLSNRFFFKFTRMFHAVERELHHHRNANGPPGSESSWYQGENGFVCAHFSRPWYYAQTDVFLLLLVVLENYRVPRSMPGVNILNFHNSGVPGIDH